MMNQGAVVHSAFSNVRAQEVRNYCLDIDLIDEAGWFELLEQFDDVSFLQTWTYAQLRWKHNIHRVIFRQDDECLGMAQVAVFGFPGLPFFKMAYIARGPIFKRKDKELNSGHIETFLNLLKTEFVDKRGYMLRVMPNYEDVPAVHDALVKNGFTKSPVFGRARTYHVDLTQSLDDLKKNLDKTWRSSLSKAQRSDLVVREGTGDDLYADFTKLFLKMLERKSFNPGIDYKEFGELQRRLPEKFKSRIWVSYLDGRPTNSTICVCLGNIPMYTLGATDNEVVGANGSYLLQWSMMEWLKSNGFKLYDLGGIDPDNNPHVFRFKSGIAAKNGREVFYVGTWEVSRTPFGRLLWNGVSLLKKHFYSLKAAIKSKRGKS